MLAVTFFNILAFLLTLLDSNKALKGGMKYGFILVTIIAAIRYDYGTDYMSYLKDFNRVGAYSISYIWENQEQLQYSDAVFKDLGSVILFRIFNPFGFFFFAALISSLQGFIYYQFIKENVRRNYYWLAIFLYLFQFEFYLLPMSMIRQGFSIALFVWSWHFIRQRKIFLPIILALLAISIHKSAIIFIPFMVLSYFPIKNGRLTSILLVGVLIVIFSTPSLVHLLFENIAGAELLEIYVKSYEDEADGSMGIIRKVLAFIPFFLSINYIRHENVKPALRTLIVLSTIGVLILPFTSIIALISRLCYYFNIFMIVAIPISLGVIKNNIIRYFFTLIICASTVYQYYDIFFHSVYTKSYLEYQTIFNML